MNQLFYGDNLDVLRRHVADESVDLVYLDPPFNSNQDYNVLFADHGVESAAQIQAFQDTWHWDQHAAAAFQEVVEAGGQVSLAMQAFRTFLGDNDMLAYLSMMAPRLLELRRVLKPTGSIYLHCDPTASHYLKLLMDGIFGPVNFRNEIVWRYKKYQKAEMTFFTCNSDRILFYVRSAAADPRFSPQFIQLDKPKKFLKRVWDKDTQRIVNAKDDEGHVTYMEVDKEKIDDVWTLTYLMPAARERLGYPTQKPETILERIINASSKEGEVVLDPFCGCGTAIAVAQRLKRQWIGIDVTHLAISLIKHRMKDSFGPIEYKVLGEPVDVDGAAELAESDPYQFQWWALGLVGARPVEQKKGADKGIDGRIYFHDEGEAGKTKQIIFSVKAGKTGSAHVRDLRGVIEREKAAIGILLTLQEPTRDMRKEAASAGFYETSIVGTIARFPRIQVFTVGELLAGAVPDVPNIRDVRAQTFKKAPKAKGKGDKQAKFGEMAAARLSIQRLGAVWHRLRKHKTVGDIAKLRRGLEWNKPLTIDGVETGNREQLVKATWEPGYKLGIPPGAEGFDSFQVPETAYLCMSPKFERGNSYQKDWELPKVIVNKARRSRDHWKVAAFADSSGLVFYQNHVGLWPHDPSLNSCLAAVLNGPLANAFIDTRIDGGIDITFDVLEAIPFPSFSDDQKRQIESLVAKYAEAVRTSPMEKQPDYKLADSLIRQIDAIVLSAYRLTARTERELLDHLNDKRRIVPFAFENYFPSDLKSYFTLSEWLSQKMRLSTMGRLTSTPRPPQSVLDALARAAEMHPQ